ncbi:thiamine biosynthesis protein ThiH [Syntrophotalea acetylenivorans]|uniref:Thiamine biosynthesis protein ThiH n=1 Tax=Syntrophotalea acetylenivorans TaxID=1842532 RepID=A0A1L3GPN3_9BACT|nr:2-iminoacetate synthase ThiH [Syntrophotalea acetylenivorans]APG27892.1 thiamine biosynthesis protein ThiH [Syntrophotalea acetylenivorans]
MTFLNEFNQWTPERVQQLIDAAGPAQVEQALANEHLRLMDLAALLSPAAEGYLEQLAQRAHRLTQQRFGKTIQLYAPLYLSNLCCNSCLYCGFNADNQMERRTLSLDEVEAEARILHERGFRHIQLLTGEAPGAVENAYLAAAVQKIRPFFSSISIEVYPMDECGYAQMVAAGVDNLTVYQETYERSLYDELHPYGPKRDFDWRLNAAERGGSAGLRSIGIGALLGLSDWRKEGFYVGLHARYLAKHFWRSRINISFPRLRPADGGFKPLAPVSDAALVQLICVMRLLMPDSALVLSTRESASLRDHLLPLGITQISAGSSTSPGGYGQQAESSQQFAIDDDRDAEEICSMLRAQGYDPVFKDWDRAFLDNSNR